MTERLTKTEIKKYWKALLGSVPFLIFTVVSVHSMVSIDSFYQYISLPPVIEHNRGMFIVLSGPILFIFGFIKSAYCLITRRSALEKHTTPIEKYMLYLLVITLFAITPAFSIGGSMYLDYKGYTRCPTHNPSPFNRWQPEYAKSLEDCPPLNIKTPPPKFRSSKHEKVIAAIQ